MIYFNGDSHTYGIDLDPQLRFSTLVSQRLDHACINQSHVGASNQRIMRTTREYLKTEQPDLVIIGWTTWEREEWMFNNQFYNVNSSGYDSLPVELEQQYKEWVAGQNEDTLKIKSDLWHKQIWQFHQELVEQNINHVFFNCMYNFFDVIDAKDWNYSFIGPYDNDLSYYWYLKNKGYATDAWYHYQSDGHACWAEVLLNFIEKNKLL